MERGENPPGSLRVMVVTLFLVEERTRSLLDVVAFNLTRDLVVTAVCRSCLDQPRTQRVDKLDIICLDYYTSLYLSCSQSPPVLPLAAQTCHTLRCDYWLGGDTRDSGGTTPTPPEIFAREKMPGSNTESLISSALSKVKHRNTEQTKRDVLAALHHYRGKLAQLRWKHRPVVTQTVSRVDTKVRQVHLQRWSQQRHDQHIRDDTRPLQGPELQYPRLAVAAGDPPLPRSHLLREADHRHADQGVEARGPEWEDLPALPARVEPHQVGHPRPHPDTHRHLQ